MRPYLFVLALLALFALAVGAPPALAGEACTTIPSGEIVNSVGETILPGYDAWGYNYQARLFNGRYCDAYRNAAWCQADRDVELSMKWNDAWLSNQDCDGDGELDRHHGFASYIGSGAWLTNHQRGTYEQDGRTCKWENFVKIVAAPEGAYLGPAIENIRIWFTADQETIGREIWGAFAIVEEVLNDPCAGDNGVQYHSPVGPGFGHF